MISKIFWVLWILARIALVIAILLVLWFVIVFSQPFASEAHAEDDRCATLRQMNQEWAGIELTPMQRAVKAKLVAWYRANCAVSIRRRFQIRRR